MNFLIPILPIGMMLAACGQSDPSREFSLAAKVASVDAGAKISEDSPTAIRSNVALQNAARVCSESELSVADMSTMTRDLLKEKGIAVNAVEVLEAIPQVVEKSNIQSLGGCSRVLAMYATARVGGQNHLAATNGLRGLLSAMR
jgi:hypothetical protein